MNKTVEKNLNSLESTKKLALAISAHCKIGDVIFLKGDLGAGKTTFAQMLIEDLCGAQDVTSPTFNILSVYDLPGHPPIYHYDLYRLKSSEELHELAIEDALHLGVTLIEWPELLENVMLKDKIAIYFNYNAKQNFRNAVVELYGRFAEDKTLLAKLTNEQ